MDIITTTTVFVVGAPEEAASILDTYQREHQGVDVKGVVWLDPDDLRTLLIRKGEDEEDFNKMLEAFVRSRFPLDDSRGKVLFMRTDNEWFNNFLKGLRWERLI